jgi:hypothetical protein
MRYKFKKPLHPEDITIINKNKITSHYIKFEEVFRGEKGGATLRWHMTLEPSPSGEEERSGGEKLN